MRHPLVAYAIFYLWFEAFPLVFIDIYQFQGGLAGLPFIGILIGAIVSYSFYVLYLKILSLPEIRACQLAVTSGRLAPPSSHRERVHPDIAVHLRVDE